VEDQLKVVIHANKIEWQQRYTRHVVSGLTQHGIQVRVTSSQQRQPCDLAILMGPNAWQRIENNGTFLMLNRKFVGNDPKVVHENCAISWNGFNGYGTFCVDEVDPSRLERYMKADEILPWRDGENTIFCEQSNVGRSTTHRSLERYYNHVKTNTNGKVIFRSKPIGEENISYEGVTNSLQKQNPKVVVNLNSTISLDALSFGIPVISLDKGDPAYAITGHTLNEIVKPDNRLEFFQHLAHCQWTEDEIKSGEFWEHIYPMRGPKLHEWTNGSKR